MKKQQIRILCAILALSLLCPCIGAAAMDAEAFDDWEPGAWYVSAMAWCVQEGYFEGTEQNTIEAGRSITRAEFLAVMVRYFRCTEPADISYFSDVSPEDWFYDAVSKDYMADITNGVSETLFAPYRNITREEAFTMFVRALNPDGPAPASLSGYEDAEQISAWARDSVAGIVALGVIEGYEDHTLRPKAEITRAEVAQMLYRASHSGERPEDHGGQSSGNQGGTQNNGGGGSSGGGESGSGRSPTPNDSSVRLDPQNGQPAIIRRIENGRISAPAIPTRAGYYFGGWYTEPEDGYRYDFDRDTATADLRLYARWYTPEEWAAVSAMDGIVPLEIYVDTELWVSRQTGEAVCAVRYADSNQALATIRLYLTDPGGTNGKLLYETKLAPGGGTECITLTNLPEPGTYPAQFVVSTESGARVNLAATVHICEP